MVISPPRAGYPQETGDHGGLPRHHFIQIKNRDNGRLLVSFNESKLIKITHKSRDYENSGAMNYESTGMESACTTMVRWETTGLGLICVV